MTKAQEQERNEAREELRRYLKPGDTVYTILRAVSRSGMSRQISVLIKSGDDFIHPNWLVAKAIGARLNRGGAHDAIVMGGCGMDMGYAIAYELSHALFSGGFTCTGDGCQSNDHSNGDRTYTPHQHKDGGYALRHAWL